MSNQKQPQAPDESRAAAGTGCGGCGHGCASGCAAGQCPAEGTCVGCANGECHDCRLRSKLHSYNYLDDIPGGYADDDMVEVQFKNTRKGYYRNSTHLPLELGEWVAVEASPGHDIGRVSMTGALVRLQMRKAGIKPDAEHKRVFRKAKASDMERYQAARSREEDTMIRARKIASSLQLNMKIGDVEYQGDGNKAIFYYIAEERVDFRQLIKVLAETFKVRIEMKQIGARQEAGRIGGIGPCGRPLCCTTWMSNFVSVSTAAARYQDISLNPQKLAGQCAKLKCCLNFEIDSYVEASKKLPPKDTRLETADNTYFYFKADILKGEITYSTDKSIPANLVTITAARAFEVIELNKNGEKPLDLKAEEEETAAKPAAVVDLATQDSLTRFDTKKKRKKKGGQKEKGAQPSANKEAQTAKDKEKPKDAPAKSQPKEKEKGSDKPKPQKQPKSPRPQADGKPQADNKPQGASAPQGDGTPRSEGKSQRDRRNGAKPRNADNRPKGERQPRPEKAEKNGKPDKSDRSDRSDKSDKGSRQPKPSAPATPAE